MFDYISYGRQSISVSDIDAVVQVLRSDFLTQGPVIPAFEKAVAGKTKVKYAVSVNSATSALHIACLALKVGHGDTVWTSPNTFVASANCARHCGASVDFVDIDPDTWCMSGKKLRQKLERQIRRPLWRQSTRFGGYRFSSERIQGEKESRIRQTKDCFQK